MCSVFCGFSVAVDVCSRPYCVSFLKFIYGSVVVLTVESDLGQVSKS